MDDPPGPPPSLHCPTQKPLPPTTSAVDSSQLTSIPPPSEPTTNAVESTSTSTSTSSTTTKPKKLKKKKNLTVDGSDAPSSSASSYCSSASQKGVRLRNPRVFIGSARQKEAYVEAMALPLGMSIAAVVSKVLERKSTTGEAIAVDHLSEICTLAVRESLANVFGDKFDSFVKNFDKSFRSTLMTLRSVDESSQSNREHQRRLNSQNNYFSDITAPVSHDDNEHRFTVNSGVRSCQSETVGPTISSEEHFGILEETEQNIRSGLLNGELALNDGEINQQLACVSSSSVNQSALGTFQRSVIEQTRSNNLKTLEIGLTMKKLKMKEKQLSLHSDLNFLERCKLRLGIERASFKAEKFKTELEETKHAELLKKCIDCLVAGLLIMLVAVGYGTYVYSHNRITEATASCMPSEEPRSWWVPKPMSSFNSGLQFVWCHVQVISRMLFGMFMILAIAYLLLQRSSVSTQTMPVTFILLLGVACGFAGKLCIDTLGGSGYHWLLYWESLCLLHFFANICTSVLFVVLYGPIGVPQKGAKEKMMFPYWIRRFLFYSIVLLILPMICGLVPFASPAEWKDHLALKVIDLLQPSSESDWSEF